jgi:hypothetical protein
VLDFEELCTHTGYRAYMPDNDTLTQSAMLKASNREDFLCAQAPELTGLHDSGIFSYHTIDTLPSKARLLKDFWSYRHKRTRPECYINTRHISAQIAPSSSTALIIGRHMPQWFLGAWFGCFSLSLPCTSSIPPR